MNLGSESQYSKLDSQKHSVEDDCQYDDNKGEDYLIGEFFDGGGPSIVGYAGGIINEMDVVERGGAS